MTRSDTFALWNGVATVCSAGTNDEGHRRAVQAVRCWLEHVDRVASTYRDDSEISALNAADGRPTRIGPVLHTALIASIVIAGTTDGLVDPTVGSITLSPGGMRIVKRASWRDIDIRPDGDGAIVTLPHGVRLDLGATAKAWAADRAAQVAAAACGGGALVNLLGDIATSGPAPGAGWGVLVTDDHREGTHTTNEAAQVIALTEGGLATSGTTVRQRHLDDGSVAAHIIDPRTMAPVVSRWRTVSVAAGDCLTANAASTAAIIQGAGAVDWLRRSGLPARLVGVDGSVAFVGGWPAPAVAA